MIDTIVALDSIAVACCVVGILCNIAVISSRGQDEKLFFTLAYTVLSVIALVCDILTDFAAGSLLSLALVLGGGVGSFCYYRAGARL